MLARISKQAQWVIAVSLFIAVRLFIGAHSIEINLILGLIYVFFLWQIIIPYLNNEDIITVSLNVKLVKGKDDLLRAVYLGMGVIVCLVVLFDM